MSRHPLSVYDDLRELEVMRAEIVYLLSAHDLQPDGRQALRDRLEQLEDLKARCEALCARRPSGVAG